MSFLGGKIAWWIEMGKKKITKLNYSFIGDGQKKSSSSGFSGVITNKQKLMYRHVDV